ncbi:MAG TPA: HD domain-containing phosphohydrolase [Nitrospiraceae bacterium]|nr:HD domain-containing phosphohydrolase [Nitrospiraceae bacterium]
MKQRVCEHIHPGLMKMQAMLRKIDRLHLPPTSRRDVENILVHQVSKEIDRALPWQAGHSRRTAAISLLIGQVVGLMARELHDLNLAALLHDIGLSILPYDLIAGVSGLDSESYLTVQNHPRLGASLLEPFCFLRRASVLIAHHHERWDGSGYPYGIRGSFIPLGARILAVVDAYDAIKVPDADPAIRNHVALRILQVSSGTQFDPELVAIATEVVRNQLRKNGPPALNEAG